MHSDPRLAVVMLALVAVIAARGRRRAVAGAAAIALGSSALRVALGEGTPRTADALRALPALSVGLDAGLEVLGSLLALSAAAAALRARDRTSLTAAGLATAAAIIGGYCGVRDAGSVGLPMPIAFGAGGALVAAAAARYRTRDPGRVLFRRSYDRPVAAGRWRWLLLVAAVTGVAVVASSAIPVMVAVAVLSIVGYVLGAPRTTGWGIPWLSLLVIPPLALAGYLMATIAGPIGLALPALAGGPFSSAAEALLVPLLAVGSAALLGLRPLHRVAPRSLLALGSVALLVRVGVDVLPGGVAGWETVAIPFGVASIAFAASAPDAVAAAAALAWIACFSTGGSGAAWWLGGTAAVASAALLWKPPRRIQVTLAAALAAAGAWGASLALIAALRTEALYGTMAWVALTIALLRSLPERPD